MIQRVQSLYMFIIFVVCILLLFLPLAVYYPGGDEGTLKLFNVDKFLDNSMFYMVALNILLIAMTLLIIYAFFLYKKRIRQNIIIAVVFFINALFIGGIYLLTDRVAEKIGVLTIDYKIGCLLPLISLVLLIFTSKAIRKDEARVRAADRLR